MPANNLLPLRTLYLNSKHPEIPPAEQMTDCITFPLMVSYNDSLDLFKPPHKAARSLI